MKDIEIAQFKQELQDFLAFMQKAVEEDSEYDGEADELIAAVQRIQVAFHDINSTADLKDEELKKIGPDMAIYLEAINELSDEEWDEEDEDEDGEEWDDEEEDEDEEWEDDEDEEWDDEDDEWEDDEDEKTDK